MQIGELLSVGLLTAGILSAIGAYINTRRKRAQKASQKAARSGGDDTAAPVAPPSDISRTDTLAGLQADDWRTRLAAVESLVAGLPDDPAQRTGALFALLPLLDDPDSDVREAALSALIDTGAAAIPGLTNALESGDVNAREGATRALGQIGGKTAIDALIHALDDDSVWVRIPAAQGLGANHAVRAVDPLIAKLDDEDAGVREAVKEALTTIGTRKALMAVAGR